jgi:hypothetical protein
MYVHEYGFWPGFALFTPQKEKAAGRAFGNNICGTFFSAFMQHIQETVRPYYIGRKVVNWFHMTGLGQVIYRFMF